MAAGFKGLFCRRSRVCTSRATVPVSARTRWNGVAGSEGGGGPFPIDGIAPYSAHFDANVGARLNLPANCAAGIVLY